MERNPSMLLLSLLQVGNFDSNYNEDCRRKQESKSKIVLGGGRLIHRAKFSMKRAG